MTLSRLPKSLYAATSVFTARGEIFVFGGIEPEKDNDTLKVTRVPQNATFIYENQFVPNRIQKGHYGDMGKWTTFDKFVERDTGDELQAPEARAFAPGVYVPNQKVYVIGGENAQKQPLSDVWCFDLRLKQWFIVGNAPEALSLSSAVLYFETMYDDEDQVNAFLKEKAQEDESEAIERLTKVSSEYQSFLKDPYRQRYLPDAPNVDKGSANYHIILYGGKSVSGKNVASVYAYSVRDKQWRQLADGPPARRGHSAVFRKGKMYIFGGYDNDKSFSNEVWEYDVKKALDDQGDHLHLLEAKCERVPQGRTAHAAILQGDRMYIFGGTATTGDMWYFDLDTQQWREVRLSKTLHGRWYHSLVYVNEMQVALIGGANSATSKALQNVELLQLPGGGVNIRESRITGEEEREEE
eukprot:CAMPEP_0117451786 /NCGR_PEP_ID=MMETSP0759-20121206/9206_1 /TAXON_ID=63605 /ORGANISM="Percolomonas cosmopolitus, Strain WS" /LENGTH=410 /DNA_ID=CAMNT_0005244435 /DNA_START=209 /DNA_END=1439 /DNA_ORIENTATION=+